MEKVLETDRHRYVAEARIAEGGMGSIYLGRRISVGAGRGDAQDEVVLKQLPPEHSHDPKLIEMFVREAQLVFSMSHKNIVRVFDLVNAGSDYYIVMEYVRGGDLRSILRRGKRRQATLSLDSVLFIVCEVLSALSYAHGKRSRDGVPLGLVHRDVSPSNVLLGADGRVKLTDFGIAKSPTQGSVVFKVKGKVGYMAPEQARGEAVDLRADLFATGVTLYELLVGERLFVGNTLQSPAVIFAQPVRPPSRRRADVGAELDAIVMRALALDPAQRYASADEMKKALLLVAQRTGRTLDQRTLATDLARVCGDDPSTWMSLDVPSGATLDQTGAVDGTGVILTGDDDDDDRSYGHRPVSLPPHELTSVVRLKSANEFEPPPTLVQRGPALRDEPHDFPAYGDDSEVRTRVQAPEEIARPPRPSALQSRGARVSFEPPVPRASPPPPTDASESALPYVPPPPVPPPDPKPAKAKGARKEEKLAAQKKPAKPVEPAFRDVPTRLSSSGPIAVLPSTSSSPHDVTRHSEPLLEAARRQQPQPTSQPHAYGPASLAALERNISGRTPLRLALTILAVALLVALGIGLGVLLSGDSGEGQPEATSPPPGVAPR